jgi:hypothetical protein
MERELLSLMLFLLAAVTGAARFRQHKRLDEISLRISLTTNYAGTFLLASTLFSASPPAALAPLSLLILLHGTALCYRNHLTQILGLPLVIGQVLLSLIFPEIRGLMVSPVFILTAWIFHTALVALGLRLLLQTPRVPMLYGPAWNPYELARKFEAHLPAALQWKS